VDRRPAAAPPLGHKRLVIGAAAIAIVLIAALWLATWQRSRNEVEQARDAALKAHSNLAIAFEQNAIGAFDDVDQLFGMALSEFRETGKHLQAHLDGGWLVNRALITGFAIVGVDGRPLVATGDAAADPEAHAYHRAHAGSELHIGRPVPVDFGRRWRTPVTRRIDNSDGSFGGFLVATIDPAFFTNFYRRTNLGAAGVIVLIDADGYALARQAGASSSYGDDMRGGTLWKIRATRPSGSYLSSGNLDGVRRLFSYRTMSRSGIIVQVGADEADVMGAARGRVRLYYLLAGLASCMISLIAVGATRVMVSQGRMVEQLAASEAQLRASEARSRAITESMAGGVVVTDFSGNILSVNPAGVFRELNARAFEFRDKGREYLSVRRDGTTFEVEVMISSSLIDGVCTYIGIVHDISERKRMQRELQMSESHLRAIFDQALIGICDSTLDGRFTKVNATFCRMLGYSEGELLQRRFLDITHPQDVLNSQARAIDIAAQPTGTVPHPFTKRYVRKDGSTMWVLLSPTVIQRDDGTPDHFTSMVQDITELKRAEQAKSEFVSTVSHELRTPLTSIHGSLGLMAAGVAGALPAGAQELAAIAARNCERLIRLVNDILDTEKMDSGRMSLHPAVVDLRAIVHRAIEGSEGFARERSVRLAFERPAQAIRADADADRLDQVLTNLLSNAVKFSPPGATVEVTLREVGGRARMEVRDHGPGIPPEFRNRIFQRFSQADGSDSRQKCGTGLGLYIAKGIVDRSGGTIGFDSNPGEGATFHVELPLSAAPAPSPNRRRVASEV
jgi:PAS domain S-box-containing protein